MLLLSKIVYISTHITVFSSTLKKGVQKKKDREKTDNDECVSFKIFDTSLLLMQSKAGIKFDPLSQAPHLSSSITTTHL